MIEYFVGAEEKCNPKPVLIVNISWKAEFAQEISVWVK